MKKIYETNTNALATRFGISASKVERILRDANVSPKRIVTTAGGSTSRRWPILNSQNAINAALINEEFELSTQVEIEQEIVQEIDAVVASNAAIAKASAITEVEGASTPAQSNVQADIRGIREQLLVIIHGIQLLTEILNGVVRRAPREVVVCEAG